MSKTLIVLNDLDIQRLKDNEHVFIPLRDSSTGNYAGNIVLLSTKCYEAYNRGEYDLASIENSRRYLS